MLVESKYIFIFDVFLIRHAILSIIEPNSDIDVDTAIQFYLERSLFKECGFNVVWKCQDENRSYALLRRQLIPMLEKVSLTGTFSIEQIPTHLRSAECYVRVTFDSAAIYYL
jgi:hypothetical protein